MPLQLLNLGVLIPRMVYRMFITRTPRGQYSILVTDFDNAEKGCRFR